MKSLAEILNSRIGTRRGAQAELSRNSGVPDPVISRARKGKRGIEENTARKLAAAWTMSKEETDELILAGLVAMAGSRVKDIIDQSPLRESPNPPVRSPTDSTTAPISADISSSPDQETTQMTQQAWEMLRLAVEGHSDPLRAIRIAVAAISKDAIEQDERQNRPGQKIA